MYDVIVVGGGASGMMAAATAALYGKKTLLIEKMSRTGRKLILTGKGRCNVTNNCDVETVLKNTVSNPKFLYSALCSFTPQDTIELFESLSVPLKIERGNRVFPISDKAMDIADALVGYCKQNGVKVLTDTVVDILEENGSVIGVETKETAKILANSVIISTGGKSYSKTGSTGDGYRFAKKLGHTVIPVRPALVGVRILGNECKEMQGLSLKNTALFLINKKNGKIIYKDMGEMLFTHFGISGPMALSASSYIKDNPNDYMIELDLKPALTKEKLDERISRDFSQNINKDIINSLDALLPKTMIPVVIKKSRIDERKKVNQITKEERISLCNTIKHFSLDVCGREGIEGAIITAGGVATNEIEPKTMQSKIVKGVYFTGEVIDVDAHTGGFNLQIAFSTGYLAGLNS